MKSTKGRELVGIGLMYVPCAQYSHDLVESQISSNLYDIKSDNCSGVTIKMTIVTFMPPVRLLCHVAAACEKSACHYSIDAVSLRWPALRTLEV